MCLKCVWECTSQLLANISLSLVTAQDIFSFPMFFFFQSAEYESKDTSVTWQAPTSDWPVLSL